MDLSILLQSSGLLRMGKNQTSLSPSIDFSSSSRNRSRVFQPSDIFYHLLKHAVTEWKGITSPKFPRILGHFL